MPSPQPTDLVFDLPSEALEHASCRVCGCKQPISNFRVFATKPKLLYMDFCVDCEQRRGTLSLYRQFTVYATEEITRAVFAAARVPAEARNADEARLLVTPDSVVVKETPEELMMAEMQRREMARRRLIFYVVTMMPDYTPGWVHQDICRRLERFVKQVERRQAPRLMIFMPPRAGKSLLASDMFVSWFLGLHPEWGTIATSYAQSLPLEFSRKIRDRLEDPEYKALFPGTRLRQDAKGIEAWKTTKGGGYVAAGIGTGITGKGFNIGIVDDPIKDYAEASSSVIRESAYQWYQSVFRTRAAPGAGILFINTRWHFDDPSGRLLDADEKLAAAGVPERERENWEVVTYPAIAEGDEYLMPDGTIERDPPEPEKALRALRKKGDALHPERFPLHEIIKIKNTFSTQMFSAMYQQAPTPDEGDYFKREDILYRWLDPAYYPLCRIFMTADYAFKKTQRADYTVIGVFALDAENNLYLLDMRRGRYKSNETIEAIISLMERYKPEVYAGEQGAVHESIWPMVEAEMIRRRIATSVDNSLVPVTDKEARARPLQARTQQRKFFFSYDYATKPDSYAYAEREMLQFPNGKFDDVVDMLAWGARLAQNLPLPNARALPKRKSWQDELLATPTNSTSFMAG